MDAGHHYWSRGSGPKVASGLLIGLGLLVMVLFQVLNIRFALVGNVTGIALIVAGIAGLLLSKEPRGS